LQQGENACHHQQDAQVTSYSSMPHKHLPMYYNVIHDANINTTQVWPSTSPKAGTKHCWLHHCWLTVPGESAQGPTHPCGWWRPSQQCLQAVKQAQWGIKLSQSLELQAPPACDDDRHANVNSQKHLQKHSQASPYIANALRCGRKQRTCLRRCHTSPYIPTQHTRMHDGRPVTERLQVRF
jgi:hypothetical protein